MKTSYFSFGQAHVHKINGIVFDKDIIVKITDEAPRKRMIELFGLKWSMEYHGKPTMEFFPRGIYDLNTREMVS